jgi:protease-4
MLVLGVNVKQAQQIAVVEMEGMIGPRLKAAEYVKLFRSIEVSSLASRKPVIAFIRGVGASGAYLLSCPASRIIAIPSALIGSIGVISMRPMVYEALDRIGVRMNVTKSDRLKDMGSMFREATEEEKQKEQALVDDLYDQFLDAVAAGRSMDKARVKEVATGEVYTARRAKELGLVDELGDLDRAIDLAAEMANAPRKPVWMRPKRGLRDVVSSMFAGAFVDAIATNLEERLLARTYYRH